MYSIDVKTEVRKIASSKPVHAAAGAGVLATQALRELPGRLVRTIDGTVNTLPGRLVRTIDGTVNTLPGRATETVTSLPGRATGYVQNARSKAADGYDTLADHGKRALAGRDSEPAKNTLNGKPSTTRTSRSSASKSSTPKTGTASKTK